MLKQELRPFLSCREKIEYLPSLQSFKCSKIFLGQSIHTELESVARRGWRRGTERGYLLYGTQNMFGIGIAANMAHNIGF